MRQPVQLSLPGQRVRARGGSRAFALMMAAFLTLCLILRKLDLVNGRGQGGSVVPLLVCKGAAFLAPWVAWERWVSLPPSLAASHAFDAALDTLGCFDLACWGEPCPAPPCLLTQVPWHRGWIHRRP